MAGFAAAFRSGFLVDRGQCHWLIYWLDHKLENGIQTAEPGNVKFRCVPRSHEFREHRAFL
jgi:hypothetical protein